MPNAHYISGTHWDREWYRTFQEYRLLFVKLVDGLLDLMENNPDFKYFHFDGQTTVLPDYIEMRPENKGRLEKLVKDQLYGFIALMFTPPWEWLEEALASSTACSAMFSSSS